jgi:hypothetical protein
MHTAANGHINKGGGGQTLAKIRSTLNMTRMDKLWQKFHKKRRQILAVGGDFGINQSKNGERQTSAKLLLIKRGQTLAFVIPIWLLI